jgi:hypothetical protein
VRKALKKCIRSWHRLGYKPVVKLVPKDATTFDRMVVVFSGENVFKVVFLQQ